MHNYKLCNLRIKLEMFSLKWKVPLIIKVN